MASPELTEFLRSVDEELAQYAQLLYEVTFTNKEELGAADMSDLEALGVPNGAAGSIIKAAQGEGVHNTCAPSELTTRSYKQVCKPFVSREFAGS